MPKTFTWEEVQQHNVIHDLHVVIDDKVYNVTKFQHEHPGGADLFLDQAAKDVTELFEAAEHSDGAKEILSTLYVGELKVQGGAKLKPKKSKSNTSRLAGNDSNLSLIFYALVATGCAVFGYGAVWYSSYNQNQSFSEREIVV